MPFTRPRTSMRRLTPWKPARAAIEREGAMPQWRGAEMAGTGDGGRRVQFVMPARKRPVYAAQCLLVPANFESIGRAGTDSPAAGGAETLDRRVATSRRDARKRRIAAICNDQPIGGQGAHEMMELRLRRGKNVSKVG